MGIRCMIGHSILAMFPSLCSYSSHKKREENNWFHNDLLYSFMFHIWKAACDEWAGGCWRIGVCFKGVHYNGRIRPWDVLTITNKEGLNLETRSQLPTRKDQNSWRALACQQGCKPPMIAPMIATNGFPIANRVAVNAMFTCWLSQLPAVMYLATFSQFP